MSGIFGTEISPTLLPKHSTPLFLPSAALSAVEIETSGRKVGVNNFYFVQIGFSAVLTWQIDNPVPAGF